MSFNLDADSGEATQFGEFRLKLFLVRLGSGAGDESLGFPLRTMRGFSKTSPGKAIPTWVSSWGVPVFLGDYREVDPDISECATEPLCERGTGRAWLGGKSADVRKRGKKRLPASPLIGQAEFQGKVEQQNSQWEFEFSELTVKTTFA